MFIGLSQDGVFDWVRACAHTHTMSRAHLTLCPCVYLRHKGGSIVGVKEKESEDEDEEQEQDEEQEV